MVDNVPFLFCCVARNSGHIHESLLVFLKAESYVGLENEDDGTC